MKKNRLTKLYNSYSGTYKFTAPPDRPNILPIRPFKIKARMQMKFVDSVGRLFEYRNGKFHYICSSIYINVIQNEFLSKDKLDSAIDILKQYEVNREK